MFLSLRSQLLNNHFSRSNSYSLDFCPLAGEMDIELCFDYLQLQSYVDHFKTVGIKTVRDLKNRTITDDLLDCLEVMVPGDRKRVKWAGNYTPAFHVKIIYKITV